MWSSKDGHGLRSHAFVSHERGMSGGRNVCPLWLHRIAPKKVQCKALLERLQTTRMHGSILCSFENASESFGIPKSISSAYSASKE